MVSNDINYGIGISSINYAKAQQYLKNQIKQPQNLADLKRNANIKLRQLELARAKGDFEIASILAYEYQRIVQDINSYDDFTNFIPPSFTIKNFPLNV